jgi:hypothetical protein
MGDDTPSDPREAAIQAWMIYRGAAPITEAEIQREMGRGGETA